MSLERQLELEETMLSIGEENYRNSLDSKDDFDSIHIQRLVGDVIDPFSKMIIKHVKNIVKERGVKRGRRTAVEDALNKRAYVNRKNKKQNITPLQLSFLTIRQIFTDLRDGKCKMVHTASLLGKLINQNLFREDRFDRSGEIRIGSVLISLLVEHYPQWFKTELKGDVHCLVWEYFDKDSKQKEYLIIPSDEFMSFCNGIIDAIAEISVVKWPMIHNPVPWSPDGKHGGWYSDQMKRNIVKGRKEHLDAGINPNIARAVNAVQDTPWKVNEFTLQIMVSLCRDEPSCYPKAFPMAVPHDPPRPTPKSLKYLEMDEVQQKEYQLWIRKTTKNAKEREAKASLEMSRTAAIQQATKFKNEPKLWFPHDIDYRNRLYNMCMTGLNTQGSDFQKGLIQFANSRPITTDNGVKWMHINMANLVGHDKLRLDERVDWTRSNGQLLRDVVKNPLKCDIWHSWDKPLQGLAAAVEYVKWLDCPDIPLNLQIQLDGLCNGVQNLAAITRDAEVAPHVGLVWTKERGDVYNFVCQAVIRTITGTGSMADEWITSGLMTRKLTKTPVMTRSYAATLYGIKDGVQDFIDDNRMASHFTDSFLAGNWMGERIWDSMENTLTGPMLFLDWVQQCAGILAEANLPLIWTNPFGMRCIQSPFVTKSKKIDFKNNGRRLQYRIQVPTNKINKQKSESSSSPNVTHSGDASHLGLTVLGCKGVGINDFAMVHDSFGSHPDDAEPLLHQTKLAWVDMYSIDWMSVWYDQWSTMLGSNDLPKPPPLGTLNIKDVMKSDFFFA